MNPLIPEAGEQVLSTLDAQGKRIWIRTKTAKGRFWKARAIVAWGLIALFTLIPYLRMNGKPLVLLDIGKRQFTLFGTTFLPTDTMFLMLLLVGIFLLIFLLTAIFGRVWCGWACPQTVYMEYVYRPLERLLEGDRGKQMRLDREGPNLRRVVKWAAFLVISAFLAHTFLAYFVGVEALARWVRQSPIEHPTAFLVMAATTILMFLDFAWFREQTCLVACPYGRLQSVLLDRNSLIIGYDGARGEPRGRPKKADAPGTAYGDCIDCKACVITCPTGIDIRNGLQMECVACTQCIDACDAIMDKVKRPRGLIRYGSVNGFAGKPARILRPRVIVYPLLLAAVFGALGVSLARRGAADVTVLRGIGAPFIETPAGEIANQIRIKIVNRSGADRSYTLSVAEPAGLTIIAPQNPLAVADGKTETTTIFVNAPRGAFTGGQLPVVFRVDDGAGFVEDEQYLLLGPAN